MIPDAAVVHTARSRGQYASADVGSMTYLFDAAAYGDGTRRVPSVRCAIAVPLPSSREPKPWLYLEPDDAEDYLDQLDAFIEEQVQAGCLLWGRQDVVDGVRFFVLAPYGFERASRAGHERLLDEVGPEGRYDPRIE